MKLDPGIHIVMHSVLSLKPGVTQQYMRAMADCIFMQSAKIKDDVFFGEAIIWINWEEVYQLFHQEDLDISMVGLWVL